MAQRRQKEGRQVYFRRWAAENAGFHRSVIG